MSADNLSTFVRSFFEQHLVAQRGLSSHTVLGYRDSLKLFFQYVSGRLRKSCTQLTIDHLKPEVVRAFLDHLEKVRENSVATRNARLAAIHAFFQYLAILDPRHMAPCQAILAVPFKRQVHRVPVYLEKQEVQAIFSCIKYDSVLGQRDDALLRLLYNTGMRAQEIVDLNICHLRLTRPWHVLIHGKGRRERTAPFGRIPSILSKRI